MTNVVSFPNAKQRRKIRNKNQTLCRNGNHKWQIDKTSKFDTSEGKLITLKRCIRCGKSQQVLT